MTSPRERMWEATVKQSIQAHERDIRVLLELLDDDNLRFSTCHPGAYHGEHHILSEPTQHLIDEALNLLLAERQESVKVLREGLEDPLGPTIRNVIDDDVADLLDQV